MFSRFFIDRPIFAFVISIFIVIAGLASMRVLPIAQYPEISPPVVTVSAFYPGASAETIAETVAAPLENSITGVEGMMYMSSSSTSNGALVITVTFEIGTNADQATVNVSNRVKQAEARLPQEVRTQGVGVEKGSSAYLQFFAFYSPDQRYDDLYISNYVTLNVLDTIKKIPGTTNVQVFGAKDYAMRIWLKPDRMAQLKVTVPEVAAALQEQNAQFAAGKIGQSPTGGDQELVYTVTAKGRLSSAGEFESIIVRSNPDGSQLRLRDIARVEIGSKDNDFNSYYNGTKAVLLAVMLKPGSNALDVANAASSAIATMAQKFPAGLTYVDAYDTTRFVKVSIREVFKTLFEAMVLVFLVVFLFLQNWRATLIPTLAVPVSLIGTFAGLHMLGYSINTLTLFGMVLAIGIVVDDAIVVLENVERIMHEYRLPAREAAIKAMGEVTEPVVAIVLVLCAVFVPIAFLGGLTGELYRQFAITISISVVLSGLIALTMTPALCVLMLRNDQRSTNRFFEWFNGFFKRMTGGYIKGVTFFMKRSVLGIALFVGMVIVTGVLWKATPSSLVPDEDQGYYVVAVYLPDGASLERTNKVMQDVINAARSNPDNEHVIAFSGFDLIGGGYKNSAGAAFVVQKDWDKRKHGTADYVKEFYMKTGGNNEALILAFAPPPIIGLANTGGFEMYLQNRGEGGNARLVEGMGAMIGAAQQSKVFTNGGSLQTLWRADAPQLFVDVDRDRAKALGVSLTDAFATLSGTLGTYYVNDFNRFGRAWQVLMSADTQYRKSPDDIGRMYVKSSRGEMVPLSAFARVSFSSGPDSMERYNNLPAVKLIGSPAPGFSSGQAIAEVERLAKQALPGDLSYEWTGTAFLERQVSNAAVIALALAAVMAFLILAAQYEKWTLPFSVLLAMPFGIFGSLVAVTLRGFTNDVYFQIGLVTLLGLAAKNAILIVEFATMRHKQGYPAAAAAIEAARLRFRPIVMTSLAFILGVTPLALSTGAGAGARTSAGTGVVGGMLAATFLAIFFVPMAYKVITSRKLKVEEADLTHTDEAPGPGV